MDIYCPFPVSLWGWFYCLGFTTLVGFPVKASAFFIVDFHLPGFIIEGSMGYGYGHGFQSYAGLDGSGDLMGKQTYHEKLWNIMGLFCI